MSLAIFRKNHKVSALKNIALTKLYLKICLLKLKLVEQQFVRRSCPQTIDIYLFSVAGLSLEDDYSVFTELSIILG